MQRKFIQMLCLSLLISTAVTTANAMVEPNNSVKDKQPMTEIKLNISPIEKALSQQKYEQNLHHTQDEIKVLSAIHSSPSQSFFALQNQKFTRFLQSLFSNNSSS